MNQLPPLPTCPANPSPLAIAPTAIGNLTCQHRAICQCTNLWQCCSAVHNSEPRHNRRLAQAPLPAVGSSTRQCFAEKYCCQLSGITASVNTTFVQYIHMYIYIYVYIPTCTLYGFPPLPSARIPESGTPRYGSTWRDEGLNLAIRSRYQRCHAINAESRLLLEWMSHPPAR